MQYALFVIMYSYYVEQMNTLSELSQNLNLSIGYRNGRYYHHRRRYRQLFLFNIFFTHGIFHPHLNTGAQSHGSVAECLTLDQGAAGSSLTGVTVLWSLRRHIYPSLVLVQPSMTCPYITERLLMGRKESNQSIHI